MNNNHKYATIPWKHRKIERVVKSTLAAKNLALEEAIEECYLIRLVLLEIFKKGFNSGLFHIHCYTGKRSLFHPVYSTKTLKENG